MLARDNPFAVEHVLKIRYRPRGWTWEQLLSRARQMKYRAAIIGPEGSGKTTLLEDLADRLKVEGFEPVLIGLTRQRRRFPSGILSDVFRRSTAQHIIFFDGCEQMSELAWRVFRLRARQAAGLIVTTHRPGRMATLVSCDTDPELLGQIVQSLLAPTGRLPPSQEALGELLERHRGNIRDAIREMYDRVAGI